MSEQNWDTYFFRLVAAAASKSKDRSVKVGAAIVGPDNAIRSLGFNGFPRGVNDDAAERHERPVKYLWTEHAERNAIYNAARTGIPLVGCSIYLDWYPCARCARAIIQAGIVEVVLDGRGSDEKEVAWRGRWSDDIDVAVEMLAEAGVAIRISNPQK